MSEPARSSFESVPRVELAPGYTISRIINGGWQLSRGHGPAFDRDAVLDGLVRLVEAGLTTFDCGDIYVGVEALLGRLARRTAHPIEVHTKLVPDRDRLPRLTRDDVARTVERSLRRLEVDRLDLVQLHWWDYDVPGWVETAGWLDELRRAGKIRLLGATNFDVRGLRAIVEAGIPLASHQVQYSLLDARPERGMTELCRAHGIHLLCYGTLAGGFLTDRWRGRPDPRPPLANRSLVKYRLIIDDDGGWAQLQRLLDAAYAVARRHGVDIASVATAFVLERPGVAAAIVGARGADHLGSAVRACALALDAEDRAALGRAVGNATGPPGDVYSAERVRGGPHAAIMRYDLNREQEGEPPG